MNISSSSSNNNDKKGSSTNTRSNKNGRQNDDERRFSVPPVMEQGGPRSHDCAAVAAILPPNSNISHNISHNMDESTEKGATTIVAAAEIEKLQGGMISKKSLRMRRMSCSQWRQLLL
jgi:hypothetical protein